MRYYYTDPLAAAWMAKHFGMEYQPLFHNVSGFDWKTATPYVSRNMTWGSAFTYYIHPDSLPLLEPKENDIGIDAHGDTALAVENGEWLDYRHELGVAAYPVKIIQRNGLPFMWPESGN